MKLRIERIYGSKVTPGDYRVLVDRLWPRGISKADASIDLWAKEIAPSDELRKWFDHDPAKFADFTDKYLSELKANPEASKFVDQIKHQDQVVLLYGAKDEEHNQAVVLSQFIKRQS